MILLFDCLSCNICRRRHDILLFLLTINTTRNQQVILDASSTSLIRHKTSVLVMVSSCLPSVPVCLIKLDSVRGIDNSEDVSNLHCSVVTFRSAHLFGPRIRLPLKAACKSSLTLP